MSLKKNLKTAQAPLEIPKESLLKHRFLTGQSVLEYAMVIMVVAAAIMAMHVYVQRSVQANLKMLEERVNAQAAQ
jgi:hypothetical protein